MNFRRNENMLLLRFANYRGHKFIEEHERFINQHGQAWMLKLGRALPEKRLKEFVKGMSIILRGPKSDGGLLYIAVVQDFFNGKPRNDMQYPKYYDDMKADYLLNTMPELQGTWFLLSKIVKLDGAQTQKLKLCSNDKPLLNVLEATRSSVMYVYSDDDIQ